MILIYDFFSLVRFVVQTLILNHCMSALVVLLVQYVPFSARNIDLDMILTFKV